MWEDYDCETKHNEEREGDPLVGVTEEAWADIQRLRRLTAFIDGLTGFELEEVGLAGAAAPSPLALRVARLSRSAATMIHTTPKGPTERD